MRNIELSDTEQKILVEILESSLPNLELEIHRTDHHEFKATLQRRRDVLQGLLDKVSQPEAFSVH